MVLKSSTASALILRLLQSIIFNFLGESTSWLTANAVIFGWVDAVVFGWVDAVVFGWVDAVVFGWVDAVVFG